MWCLAYLTLTTLLAVVNQAASQSSCTPCCCVPSCSDGDYSEAQNRDTVSCADGNDDGRVQGNQSPEMEEEQQARGPLLSMLIGAFNDPPWETTSSEETRLPFRSRLRNNRPRGMGSIFGRLRERSKLRMQKLYEYFRPNFQPQNAVMDGGYPGGSGGLGMGTGGGGGLGIRGVGQAPVTIHLNDYSTKQYVNVNSGGVKNGTDGGATHGGISLSANPTFGTG